MATLEEQEAQAQEAERKRELASKWLRGEISDPELQSTGDGKISFESEEEFRKTMDAGRSASAPEAGYVGDSYLTPEQRKAWEAEWEARRNAPRVLR